MAHSAEDVDMCRYVPFARFHAAHSKKRHSRRYTRTARTPVTWLSPSVATAVRRRSFKRISRGTNARKIRKATERIALKLAQRTRTRAQACANDILRKLGYEWRLARSVLAYQVMNKQQARRRTCQEKSRAQKEAAPYVHILDDAVPVWALARLTSAFARTSQFWDVHGYDVDGPPIPFFSYVHSLKAYGEMPPVTADPMDACVHAIRDVAARLFPAVQKARFVEWWVHCRRHGRGHQLHFDSDAEGDGADGPRHPIASAVLSLGAEGVGGPTLVTTQTRENANACGRGWLVMPAFGRLTVFDGRLLHGVIPGRGPAPTDDNACRITWMCAFWDTIDAKGAAKPAPAAGLGHIRALRKDELVRLVRGKLTDVSSDAEPRVVTPQAVFPVWERTQDGGTAVLDGEPLVAYDACFVPSV
ncbi:Fe2OG dioxygenase domain-containing protein [Pseudoscourfieldia marina]